MKRLKILAILLVVLGIGAFATWKYVNKGREDISDQKPSISYSVNELISKCDADTNSLVPYKNKVVAVKGNVKSVSKQMEDITLELGDSTNLTSIVCQIDDRYIKDFGHVAINQEVSLKGTMTFDIDDLGMGNTIHLDNCTLHK